MSDEKVLADYQACDALLCEDEPRDDFIAENIDRIEIWKKAAESGDAAGQLLYGLCFFYGHGEQQDDETAIQWFLKSAEQANAQAQCTLGNCFQNGWGVAEDADVANDWFAKAAAQGHKKSCEELPLSVKVRMGIEEHKVLCKEIAVQFRTDENSVDLDEFTAIEDDAAEVLGESGHELFLDNLLALTEEAALHLAKYKGGTLSLNGLIEISDSIAEKLGEAWILELDGLRVLDASVANYLSKVNALSLNSIDNCSDEAINALVNGNIDTGVTLGLTSLSESAAKSMGESNWNSVSLPRLTSLSEKAANHLAAFKGEHLNLIRLDLESLSDAAYDSLSKFTGVLDFSYSTTLSDSAASQLANFGCWQLVLSGLEGLSDSAAKSLSNFKGECLIIDLDELPESAADILRKHPSLADED